jgi:hypothetical protein
MPVIKLTEAQYVNLVTKDRALIVSILLREAHYQRHLPTNKKTGKTGSEFNYQMKKSNFYCHTHSGQELRVVLKMTDGLYFIHLDFGLNT